MFNRYRWFFLVIGLLPTLAVAQPYPAKPVKLVVGFAPGGAADQVSRAYQEVLSRELGQPVLVENRAGAGSSIAAEYVAKSAPDGYTLLIASPSSILVNPILSPKAGFDPRRDLLPVSKVSSSPLVVAAHASVGAANLRELIALAKKSPGKLNYGSSGNGSAPHLAGEMLAQATGVKLVHVPFKGGAPALTEVMAGRIQLYFSTITQALPSIKAGKLKALAISSRKRSAALPDVPTLEEAGVPNFDIVDWFGLLAPRATPAATMERLSTEVIRATNQPELRGRLAAEGFDVVASTPEEFDRLLRKDIDLYGRVVKSAGVKIE